LIGEALQLPFAGIERLAGLLGRVLDPDHRILTPSDSSLAYEAYLLMFFAVVGAAVAVLAYLAARACARLRRCYPASLSSPAVGRHGADGTDLHKLP
jgi:hypothetical protein